MHKLSNSDRAYVQAQAAANLAGLAPDVPQVGCVDRLMNLLLRHKQACDIMEALDDRLRGMQKPPMETAESVSPNGLSDIIEMLEAQLAFQEEITMRLINYL